MSSKSHNSHVSRTFLLEDDPSRSSNRLTSKYFEIENTLRECNIMVDAEACQSCHSLLKILKRTLKVDVAVITQFNVNSVLFRLKDRRTSSKSVLISSDIDQDNKVDEIIRQKFRGNIKSVFTSRIEYEYGQYGSLIALSSAPRQSLTPDDLAILQDISRCIESIINHQGKTSTWSSSRSNLSLCSGLLGCLKPSLSDLTSIFYSIKESWDEMNQITAATTPLHLRQKGPNNILERYKRRLLFKIERVEILLHDFTVTQGTVCNSIERILAVAKGYFLKDQETYIKTCSELVGVGLVEKINKTLKRLSEKLPSNSILWCFKVDTILAHAAHRTFYHHLTLFLENIIYYWSRYCSTTQMFICFEPIERNELPVRIPNVLYKGNQVNEHGENVNDYTYVIEGYIKVLLQFPDKHHPRFRYSGDGGDDASAASSLRSKGTAKTGATGLKPPGLTLNTKNNSTPQRPPVLPQKSEANRTAEPANSSIHRSPKHHNHHSSAGSVASKGSQKSKQSNSILRHFRFSLKPEEEEGDEEQQQPPAQGEGGGGENSYEKDMAEEEEDMPEDEFDPDHPVHHIEPLLGLLNSSLLRLNEISTAKSVNIMSESTKNQTDEAYFIRIPCLLYLTSAMDTSFLQYHGYKYNDFRFQKKKKKNGGGAAGGNNPSSKKHPHPRDLPPSAKAKGEGGDKPASKKLVRKSSKQRLEANNGGGGGNKKKKNNGGILAMISRFGCFLNGKKHSSKTKEKRRATTRFVVVHPDSEKQQGDKKDDGPPPVVMSPSNSSDLPGGFQAARR